MPPCDYKNDYPENWKSEIRPAILERDNHCCKFCGLPNYAWVNKETRELCLSDEFNAIKIILTIMHLDHNTENNSYDNLAAGCQKCHNSYDRNHRNGNAKETNRKKKGLQNLF